jgi:hypothetical protein
MQLCIQDARFSWFKSRWVQRVSRAYRLNREWRKQSDSTKHLSTSWNNRKAREAMQP